MNCSYCGKTFPVFHKARVSAKNVCCSIECSSSFRIASNPNWVPCAICGKRSYKKPNEIASAKQPLTCSRTCLGLLRKELYSGESNPNYGNRGEQNPLFVGGRRVSNLGYILIYKPEHPFARDRGYVLEHRLVAETFLDLPEEQTVLIDGIRYLSPSYHVHHKDEDKTNNMPSNLEVMTPSQHMSYHSKKRNSFSS